MTIRGNIPYASITMKRRHQHADNQLFLRNHYWEGEFPPKAKVLVKEFILKYQKELDKMWETEQYIKLPPLL